MTVIVGVVNGSDVVMACDSSGETAQTRVTIAESKIQRHEGLLIGTAGSGRVKDILRDLRLPTKRPSDDARRYVTATLIPIVRKALVDGGHAPQPRDHEEGDLLMNAELLIATAGRLFWVNADMSVVEPRCGYAAIGSGAGPALGSLFTKHGLAHHLLSTKSRLREALRSAEEHAPGVRAPFRSYLLRGRP